MKEDVVKKVLDELMALDSVEFRKRMDECHSSSITQAFKELAEFSGVSVFELLTSKPKEDDK